jgi:predicted ATPase/class 3 adenylate cyclase/DNA-binding winged helix-turn-helix (wHTH) protein
MDFRILGPLEALDGGQPVALEGSKRRALLALLLLHANETLSSDRLIDELWGEQPPATAAKTLQVHVSRLRKALTGGAAAGSDVVVTREHGYELRVELEQIDAHRFERLLNEGRRELAADRPHEALAAFEEALALWRGPPLADLAYEPFAQVEVARLEDLRAETLEQLIEAKLALGRHVEVIGQLEALIDEHPFRERLRAQLMLALYRADRQADALQAFQEARRLLVEELGIEPGQRLRELEAAVLAQDPALAQPAVRPTRGEPVAPGGADTEAVEGADEAALVELPTGVVTFLLTDIEGSSMLWESDPEAMAAALELHDELIAAAAQANGGRLLKSKGEGDSTLTVFRRASDAVAAAAEFRAMLAGAAWPGELEPRVRIAIHTGEAHERDGDYFGPALNRAARLRALAPGAATLLSQATTEIVRDRLPPGTELIDLGRQELRGLARPEQVFELRSELLGVGERPPPAHETRKTVTVLFACVIDSTSDREDLDAEARLRASSQYLGGMRAVLERHGGTVEDYPGDALMAVFGIPLLHDDDACRAVRAAVEMREVLAGLGDELEPSFGVRSSARVGIGTGEVLADQPAPGRPLASGDAVNSAKRLEELAGAGEILIDDATHRLARDLVATEPAELGSRVVELRRGGARPRRLDSPLVGRTQQLEALSSVLAAAEAHRACHLVTVLGGAGVGKSRLVEEFIDGLGDRASVLSGRCLPYGEGITYWPLGEIVRDLIDVDEDGQGAALREAIGEQLTDEPKAEQIVTVLAEAVGLGGAGLGTSEKIFWAARRLFEALARQRPLVVVLDDLQWAEPTFLDLVEHVADLSRDTPIVLLCMARAELLEQRPGWSGGKLNATSILLEPLAPDESRELVANLLSRGHLPSDEAGRIAAACEGNPLFVEELLAMLIDDRLLQQEDGRWTLVEAPGELPVPPTIHALLAARLERLPEEERALLARISVEGTVFHREAVRELAPPSLLPVVDRSLTALVRKDVIRPDRSSFPDDDAFRFRHMLIRDAAYRSLPKEARADLHERFAAWLERVGGPRLPEFEEILGYHLEHAYQCLAELGPVDADAEALADRGSERLESAGRRALGRSDRSAAVMLFERAAALVPGHDARQAALLPDLGAALIEAGRLAEADAVLAAATRAAAAAEDDSASARTLVQQEFLRLQRGEAEGTIEAAEVVQRVLPIFRRTGDEQGLCGALRLDAWRHWIEAQVDAAAAAWEEAATHARNAGVEYERIEILGWIASSLFLGPTHVTEGIQRCNAILAEVESNLAATADVLRPLAGLHAMQGRFHEARELLAASDTAFEELGLTLSSAVSHHAAEVELLAGDPVAAERSLRRGYAALEEMGDRALLSTTAAFLGQALLAQGRVSEAESLADLSAELATGDDLLTQVLWRGVRVRSLVGHGRPTEAEGLAREAVRLVRRTDLVNETGNALTDLAIVLRGTGQEDEARKEFGNALRLYEQKGNAVAAERVQSQLATTARL